MSRLPIVADDLDNWGTILNDFLLQIHNADGTLRDEMITALKINAADVAAIRTKLDIIDEATVIALIDDLSGVTDIATARSNLSVYSQAEVASAIAAVVANYLLKAGGTMTGKIILDGAPTIDLHAATKKYVDDSITVSPFHDHTLGDGAKIPQDGLSDIFGGWDSSKTYNTIYQATTDGFAIAHNSTSLTMVGYTDSTATPTTIVAGGYDAVTNNISLIFPVKKDDYWKITASSGTTVLWIPLGS